MTWGIFTPENKLDCDPEPMIFKTREQAVECLQWCSKGSFVAEADAEEWVEDYEGYSIYYQIDLEIFIAHGPKFDDDIEADTLAEARRLIMGAVA